MENPKQLGKDHLDLNFLSLLPSIFLGTPEVCNPEVCNLFVAPFFVWLGFFLYFLQLIATILQG